MTVAAGFSTPSPGYKVPQNKPRNISLPRLQMAYAVAKDFFCLGDTEPKEPSKRGWLRSSTICVRSILVRSISTWLQQRDISLSLIN